MKSRVSMWVLFGALLIATTALYIWRLDDTPTLTRDEAFVGLSAYSIATTGHDLERRVLPVYFRSSIDGTWWSTILPYVVAGLLKILPLTEATIRAPMVFAGILNVVLVFFIGRKLFDKEALALIPAALLALTPVQLIENRYANDPGLPTTFVLIWMLIILKYLTTQRIGTLVGAGLVLGVGIYSYVGAVPLMTLLLALTCTALWRRHEPWNRYLTVAASFAVPIALGLPWFVQHPDAIRTTFLHYQTDPRVVDTSSAMRLLVSFRRIAEMAVLYVEFWDPRFLFVRGSDVLRHSTGHVGLYLVSTAGLLPFGLVQAVRRARFDSRFLILAGGFLLTPLPSCLVDFHDALARQAIWRASAVLSLGALLVGVALEDLLTESDARRRVFKWCVVFLVPLACVALSGPTLPHRTVLLLALCLPAALALTLRRVSVRQSPAQSVVVTGVLAALAIVAFVQYGDFYREYMNEFRTRSMVETDGNMRGLLETAIRLSPPNGLGWIYLGFRLGPADWGGNYWRFYVHRHHREDLLLRTMNDENASHFNHKEICLMPPESLLTTRVGWDANTDALIDRMLAKQELVKLGSIGWPIYWLMRKTETCTLD